jgi:hypothetical protein
MSAVTRRRYPKRQGCWHIFFGDVHVGTIAVRTGVPHDEDRWRWICGFYPGSEPREYRDGIAATFDKARAAQARPSGHADGRSVRGIISGLGQNATLSARDHFRSSPISGRFRCPSACLKGAHVWTAPAVQEESDISAKRSGAAMYPAFECSRLGRWP